ncbi:MAG TPA: aldolase/citrate lyase family protein [Acidimicrobiales bacterium]|nr:aldolase/citrate lyase family protein [Acidimicrobiales bacterium]
MEQFLSEAWQAGRAERAGQPAFGLWSSIGDPFVLEALAVAGPDYVCIDMQHGLAHEGSLVSSVQAVAAGGSLPVVRVPEANAAAVMKALDAGAGGVVVPLVESGAEAKLAVDACRFPPAGTRSYGPFRASIAARTSDPRQLEKVALIAMIETRAGIANLEEIAATEGLSALYVGPSDLSLALGLDPGSFDAPEFVAVLEQIRSACERHGIVAGLHCYEGTMARRYADEGFGMVTVAVDMRTLRSAVAAEMARARSSAPAGG